MEKIRELCYSDMRAHPCSVEYSYTNNLQNVHEITRSNVEIYPDYKKKEDYKVTSDIAILVLNDPIVITNSIRPICLPVNANKLYTNRKATVIGWGSPHRNNTEPLSDKLKELDLHSISNRKCKTTYPFIKR